MQMLSVRKKIHSLVTEGGYKWSDACLKVPIVPSNMKGFISGSESGNPFSEDEENDSLFGENDDDDFFGEEEDDFFGGETLSLQLFLTLKLDWSTMYCSGRSSQHVFLKSY